MQLIVQPMMEVGVDKEDGWGYWDDEIADRRVKHIVELIEGGRDFSKPMWRGGDAVEGLYDHERAKEVKEEQKRKRLEDIRRATAVPERVLKQRRVSGYFRKPALVDDDRYEALEARVVLLERVVERLKKRGGKRKRRAVTPRKELLCSVKVRRARRNSSILAPEKESSSDAEEEASGDMPDMTIGGNGGGDDSEPDGTEGPTYFGSPPGGDDEQMDVDGDKSCSDVPESESGEPVHEMSLDEVVDAGVCKKDIGGEEDESASKEEGDVIGGYGEGIGDGGSSDEEPPILVPLKEGDGVPLQWVEEGVYDNRGSVMYRATTSSTYYVSDEKVMKRRINDVLCNIVV